MILTLIFTIIAVIAFFKAKEERDRTGAVRTPQTAIFTIAAVAAFILWMSELIGRFFG